MDDLLSQLARRPRPLRIGVVGAGKFATMFMTQARHVGGLELAWVADLDLERARAAANGAPVGAEAEELIAREEADVVIEATGSPRAGARHALAALEHGQHDEYGVQTDREGRWGALYRPSHLIGLELGVSVLRAGLRSEATGFARALYADVVSVAKRDLVQGDILDGEGVYCASRRLVPIARSLEQRLLPMGLSAGAAVTRPVAAGETIDLDAVEVREDELVARLRRESLDV